MKKIIKIILVFFCMFTIFNFSSDDATASDKKSDKVIVDIAEKVLNKKLDKKETKKYISKYVFYVRKSAHFFIYFILGILVISLLTEYKDLNYKLIAYTMIFVVLYAISDEIHQLFVPGRAGRIFDVGVDSLGGFTGSNIYYFLRKLRLKLK